MRWSRTILLVALIWVLATAPGCARAPGYGQSWAEQFMAEPEECSS